MTLSIADERFCAAMITAATLSEAYRKAFPQQSKKWKPETINNKASKMMQRDEIQARVAELRAKVIDTLTFTERDIVEASGAAALFDIADLFDDDGNLLNIKDIPPKTRMAIQGIDVEALYDYVEDGEGKSRRQRTGDVKKFRFADKNSAQERLMKFFGSFKEDHKQQLEPLVELFKSLKARGGSKLPVKD